MYLAGQVMTPRADQMRYVQSEMTILSRTLEMEESKELKAAVWKRMTSSFASNISIRNVIINLLELGDFPVL